MKIVARIDPSQKNVIVRFPDGRENRYGTVTLKNVEFGAGMVRGDVIEVFAARMPSRHMRNRAYFNRNKVARYVDKSSGKVLTDAAGAMMTGNTVFYI